MPNTIPGAGDARANKSEEALTLTKFISNGYNRQKQINRSIRRKISEEDVKIINSIL